MDAEAAWEDATRAVELLAVAPRALQGLSFRAGPGPQRDALLGLLREVLPPGAPVLRVPQHIGVDRLLGGLSLADTLRTGRPVWEQGLLSRADGGVVVVPMAERAEAHVVSGLCAALDQGALTVERDGLSCTTDARLAVLALDEGLEDERLAAPLRERLAFQLDFTAVDPRAMPLSPARAEDVARARVSWAQVEMPDDALTGLCEASLAFGVPTLRGPLLAVAAARAHAALAGRAVVEEEDVVLAARLVLSPRATRLPASEESQEEPQDTPPPPNPEDDGEGESEGERALGELLLEAVRSGLPPGMLARLKLQQRRRPASRAQGRAGELRAAVEGGRPAGVRAGVPGRGERLALVDTLRAAAPWQGLRRAGRAGQRIEVRKDDLKVTRFRRRGESCVIFCVDASGSSAAQRLAEAKGAVEQVLADCYARRDHVALVGFRGQAAQVLLPPTRSLNRVKRTLAGLPGGGATPLASGLEAALALALDARQRGRTPVVVVMTDGRANFTRDGRQGSGPGLEDATQVAQALRAEGLAALFLDTSPRPRPQARALAEVLGALYLPLPALDAKAISRQVQGLAGGGR